MKEIRSEKMSEIKTLNRAFDILFLLTESEETLSVSEIAARTEIPESTTYRLIQSLEKKEVIHRQTGKISLGTRILDMAKTIYEQLNQNLVTYASPIMEQLSKEINETSILVIRRGNIGVTVHYVNSSHLIGFVASNGRTHPLHLGASGKAILAFESNHYIDTFIREAKIKDKEKLLSELSHIKSEGYVKTTGEVDLNIVGIAAPIFDQTNMITASLSVIGPEDRFSTEITEKTIASVKRAANEITKKLCEGYL